MALDHLTRQYSQRLGVLTGAQLQAALDRFGLGELIDATPVKGGLFGQNVFLTASSGEYVLRGKPHYPWQLAKERFFSDLISERTSVPAPRPYLVETSSVVFGWSYAVMPRLPGLQLADPAVRAALSTPDRLDIAGALGDALTRLRALTWAYPGRYDQEHDSVVPNVYDHRTTVLREIDEYVGRCVRQDVLTVEDMDWLPKVIEGNDESLDTPFTPAFVHHDFKEGNVVVERDDDGWHVSGVFDLMEAYFGDQEEDLARPMLDYLPEHEDLARAFVRAYAAAAGVRPGAAERVPAVHAAGLPADLVVRAPPRLLDGRAEGLRGLGGTLRLL